MTPDELERRAAQGAAIVREAGRLALRHFRHADLTVEAKGLQDLVTVADREVETLIRERLDTLFPGEAVLGEEEGGIDAATLWVIDPIDGTANFARGVPYWTVVLALALDGAPVIGLTYDPCHDELFVAVRDLGARRDGRPISVSGTSRPADACIGLSYTFKSPPRPYLDIVNRLLAAGFDHRRLGSSALTLCHVADGRLDGILVPYCNSWDVIAGLLTVEEAGGYATPFAPPGGLTAPTAILACTPDLKDTLTSISRVTGAAVLDDT